MKTKKGTAKISKSDKSRSEPSAPAAKVDIPLVLDPKAFVAEHGHLLEGQPTKRAHLSVRTLADHAVTLLGIAIPNEAKLVAVGLDPRYLRELPLRVALARSCQVLRQLSHRAFTEREAKAIAECQIHRDEMMRICRHAFRKMARMQQTLTDLQEGKGVKDLLEDSIALRAMIAENPALVRATGNDPDKLVAQAVEHEKAIENISPDHASRNKGGSIEVLRRNQSVHYLLEGLREVRDQAAFAFDKDEKISAVLQGLGTLWQATKKAGAEEESEEEETEEEETEEEEGPQPVV